jgi:Zn-finger nucleic acid-binding protein
MNPMRQYERNRVVVDQCVECHGIFLDRGELESLVKAEQAYYSESAPAPVGPPPSVAPGYDPRFDDRYRDYPERRPEAHHSYGDRYYPQSKKRKARSFLEDLFDD